MALMKRFLTPIALDVVFVLGLVVIVVSSVLLMLGAAGNQGAVAFAGFAQGFLLLIVGPVLLRVACELVLVVFRIYEKLERIDDRLALLSAGKVPTKTA